MKTIAFINQKGGVGKTTSAVTVAHGLAKKGLRVVLIDLDAQGNVADALGIKKEPRLYRLLIDNVGNDAIVSSGRPNLDVITGNKLTVEAKAILVGRPFRERALRKALETLSGYDVAICDVAPSVDLLQLSSLIASDGFLIPVALDHLAVVGASDALISAAAIKEYGELDAKFLGVLPTFWERVSKESRQQMEALTEQFDNLVWPPIPRDVKVRESPAYGQTLFEYAPECRALDGIKLKSGEVRGGYRQVLDRLIREMEL